VRLEVRVVKAPGTTVVRQNCVDLGVLGAHRYAAGLRLLPMLLDQAPQDAADTAPLLGRHIDKKAVLGVVQPEVQLAVVRRGVADVRRMPARLGGPGATAAQATTYATCVMTRLGDLSHGVGRVAGRV
jgi:hypothetical protein